ncbi:hypothetical protein Q4562_04175 [Zobellia uliginosa]|nr:hypothetical protein [Zobellia uliginosa]
MMFFLRKEINGTLKEAIGRNADPIEKRYLAIGLWRLGSKFWGIGERMTAVGHDEKMGLPYLPPFLNLIFHLKYFVVVVLWIRNYLTQ